MVRIKAESAELPVAQFACPECGCTDLFIDREKGEIVCRHCGLVLDDGMMDGGPEWRAYTPEEKESRERTGMPPALLIHDKGLSTEIGRDNRDAHGQELTAEAKFNYYRLRKQQSKARICGSAERNLVQAMAILDMFSSKLTISHSVKEQSASIYRKALNEGLVRGRSIRSMVAACMYVALRISNIPRSLSEVSKITHVEKKELARCYRLILQRLDITVSRQTASSFISRIAEKVEISSRVEKTAVKILQKASAKRISHGKDPRGLAAAAIYAASKIVGKEVTQSELAVAARVTEVTIRTRYKDLCRSLGIKIPSRK